MISYLKNNENNSIDIIAYFSWQGGMISFLFIPPYSFAQNHATLIVMFLSIVNTKYLFGCFEGKNIDLHRN